MTRNQMTQMLAETISVSSAEAGAALEARDWDVLQAARLLQRQAQAKRITAARADRSPRRAGIVRDMVGWFAARHAASAETAVSARTLAPLFLMPSIYGL